MQYYIKIFRIKPKKDEYKTEQQHIMEDEDPFVGYYKETGKNCVSKMLNGIKYFNSFEEAQLVANELNGGFLRDRDKHYYTAYTVTCGDSNRQIPKEIYRTRQEKESELADELEAFIRKNSSRDSG